MKKFLPYFRLLLLVKWRFALALVAGIVYGVASGFGLPFMASKIFPLLFSSGQQELAIAVKSEELKPRIFDLGTQETFQFGHKLHRKGQDGWELLPEGTELRTNGTCLLPGGKELSMEGLAYLVEGKHVPVQPKLFVKAGGKDYGAISSAEPVKKNPWILLGAVMMMPLVFLFRGIAGFINTYQITYCGNFVLQQIRSMTFGKLQRLDLTFFQRNGSGDLMTRLMTETARLQQMLTSASNDLIKQPITFFGAVVVLVYLSIQQKELAFILMCLAIIPLIIFPVRKLSKRMLGKMRKGAAGEGHLGNCVQENLMGVRDIRSFNLEEHEISKFGDLLDRFFRTIMKMTKYRSVIPPSVEFITATGISVAIFYAAQGGLTLEKVLPLIFALYMCYEPIKRMGQLQSQLILGKVAIERLEAIIHAEESVKDPVSPKHLPPLEGRITFSGVTFNYEPGKPALLDVTAEIQPGEIVALVGPSGAGKSTFTHLISRAYEFQKGVISFDGLDIRDYSLRDIRTSVSLVSQDPYLFNDTVANNIRLGKLSASEEEIRQAAQIAHAHEFIRELPQGYQTIVGEKATRLSGGQKQRLAIARAFLKDAPILILDEATSALDAESEQAVQGALGQLVQGRTTLIIAHRFSSIQIAGRILVFDQGRIVGEGSHDSLMLSLPLYQELYRKQMLG